MFVQNNRKEYDTFYNINSWLVFNTRVDNLFINAKT